jgi:hypothetical protein
VPKTIKEMVSSIFNNQILAIALPSLRISSPLIRIATIVLFYAVAVFFIVIYIQSIGSGIGVFSGLFSETVTSHLLLSYSPSEGGGLAHHLLMAALLPIKPQRLTKKEQEAFSLSSDLKEIFVGLLLGDLLGRFRYGKARFVFKQGLVHESYLLHLYEIFKGHCPSAPKISKSLPHYKTGKIYSSILFSTYTLPCFNELYNLFYLSGKKVVPSIIEDLLTPPSLAY